MIILKKITSFPSFSKACMLATAAATLLSGCHSINYKEAAYSALRHNDCQRNEIEVFCTRSYHREYQEYERTRDELLRDTRKTSTTTGTNSSWNFSTASSAES